MWNEAAIDFTAKLLSRGSNLPGEGHAGSAEAQFISKISLGADCFDSDREAPCVSASKDRGERVTGGVPHVAVERGLK